MEILSPLMKSWAGGGAREKAQRQRRGPERDPASGSAAGPLTLAPRQTNVPRTDLLESTARLSLATARQVRGLCAIACRTIMIPLHTIW